MKERSEQTGLEFLRGLMAGSGSAPLGLLLGFYLVEVEDGVVTFGGTPSNDHYNPANIVHGGYAATILDSAMGCAVETKLGKGVGYSTVELKINYIRAMNDQTGKVRATGTVVHVGKRMATAEGRLTTADGKLLAHGSTTCMIHGG